VELNEKMLVIYLDLEGGIFVLKSEDGATYFPVNIQDELNKLHGKYLHVEGRTIDSESFQMNGLPIIVDNFSLIN
jgi:hypothetical protein